MSMGKTDLEHCVDLVRMAQRQTPATVDYDALSGLIRAVGHLAEHCRRQLIYQRESTDASISGLATRIDELEKQDRQPTDKPDDAEEKWRHVLKEIRDCCRRNNWPEGRP